MKVMETKVGNIYKDNITYYQIVEIYSPDRLGYNSLIKELGIKTKATIIKYHKSTSKDFIFGLVNYQKLSDFKKNCILIIGE